MKCIIAGSRTITDYALLCKTIKEAQNTVITEVVSGGAPGVDKMGERWAKEHNVPCRIFPAYWDLHGKSAGYKRNEEMAKYADSAIILWDGVSKGTHHMIAIAYKYDLHTVLKIHQLSERYGFSSGGCSG